MTNLRKFYYHIVEEIEKTLPQMDDDQLLQWEQMKAKMQTALIEVEEEIAKGIVKDM